MLLQLRFETQQNIRLWIGDHVGNGEIRKVREKKWGSRASPTLLLSSIRSLFFHVRSVANLHHLVAWNRLAKRWQTNQARVVRLCFMAALLPQIWNIYYDMFQWCLFCRSIDVIFCCFREKSPVSVTKVPAAAGSQLLFWGLRNGISIEFQMTVQLL